MILSKKFNRYCYWSLSDGRWLNDITKLSSTTIEWWRPIHDGDPYENEINQSSTITTIF